MKKILCKIFGHKPISELSIYEDAKIELTTYTASCGRCSCKLFGMQFRGEFSGELIKTFIKI